MDMSSTLMRIDASFSGAQNHYGDLKSWTTNREATNASDASESKLASVEIIKQVLEQEISKLKLQWKDNSHVLGVEIQKVNLFLLLRTNFKSLQNLAEDMDLEHLASEDQQLSRELYVKLIDSVGLHRMVCEAIFYSPVDLSIDVIDALARYVETNGPVDLVAWKECLAASMTKLLEYENQADVDSPYSKSLSTCCNCLLSAFMKAKSRVVGEEQFMNSGRICWLLLKTLCFCLENFLPHSSEDEGKVHHPAPDLLNITLLGLVTKLLDESATYMQFYPSCRGTIGPGTKYCLKSLLEACRKNLMTITVDTWIFLCECDGPEGTSSLQTAVGHLAYRCQLIIQDVLKSEDFDQEVTISMKELLPVLSGVAIKPLEEVYDKNDITSLTRIINTQQGRLKQKCFGYLLVHPDLFSSSEGLACVESHLDLIRNIDVSSLVAKAVNFLKEKECASEDVTERVKLLALQSMTRCLLEDQLLFLQVYLNKYGEIPVLQLKDFEELFTGFLNKSVERESTEKMSCQIVKLCLQNPLVTLERLVSKSLSNQNQTPLMAELLQVLICACRFPVSSESSDGGSGLALGAILRRELQRLLSEEEQSNFLNLVKLLLQRQVISAAEIGSIMLPLISDELQDKNDELLVQTLKVFQLILKVSTAAVVSTSFNIPVLAIFFAQMLPTYNLRAMVTNSAVLDIREIIVRVVCLIGEISNEETIKLDRQSVTWFQKELVRIPAKDQVYLYNLICAINGKEWVLNLSSVSELMVCYMRVDRLRQKLDEGNVMTFLQLENVSHESILSALVQVLPDSILSEWKNLVQLVCILCKQESMKKDEDTGMTVFNLFQQAIWLLVSMEASGSESSPSTEYATKCFSHVIKDEIYPLMTKRGWDTFSRVFRLLVAISQQVGSKSQQHIGMLLVSLLSDTVKESGDALADALIPVTSCLYLLPDGEIKKLMAQRVLKMIKPDPSIKS